MHLKGLCHALLSAMLFGTVTGLSKLLLGSLGPATLGAVTYLGAGMVGLLAVALAPAPSVPPAARKEQGGACFGAALVLGAVVAPLLLMTGLQSTSASLASILTNLEGIATVGLAWLFFREKSDRGSVICILAILAGVACFTFSGNVPLSGNIGPVLVALAYLCWALDINLMRRVTNITMPRAVMIRGFAGAFVMMAVAWLWREPAPGNMALAAGLLTGAVGFGVSFILILNVLPTLGAAKAGAIFASAPIFSYLCSSLLESGTVSPSSAQLVAIVLIVCGIVLAGINAFRAERLEQGLPAPVQV
ncbi:MAG TPA: DMT family transporter [Noviherbaspirillum sp.]